MHEVSLTVRSPRPAVRRLSALFAACGIASGEIAVFRDAEGVRCSWYTPSPGTATALRRRLAALAKPDMKVSMAVLRAADWQTKWQHDVRPLCVTRDIRIVPAWMRRKVRKTAAHDIYIDAAMAFGTGLHPTTRAVAGFLERQRGAFADFLDIGTGTGILSLIAARYGAHPVWSIDLSPDAVATARRNFRLNRCLHALLYAGDFGAFRRRRSFDFVAANILAPVLIALRDAIITRVRPGKYLAVAGIWKDDARRFRALFETGELHCLEVRKTSGWLAFLYQRTVH